MPANLSERLVNNLAQLSADSNEMYLQHKNGVGGSWSMPYMVGLSWDGDLFDRDSMAEAFERSSINNDYSIAIRNSVYRIAPNEPDEVRGTIADIAACQAQAGYLAQRERAFRARHTTPILANCFAAARRRGHGQNNAEETGVFGCTVNAIVNLLYTGRM